jgi:hypothetical protein
MEQLLHMHRGKTQGGATMKYQKLKTVLIICSALSVPAIPAAAMPITINGTSVAQTLYDRIVPVPAISNITLVPGTLNLFGPGGDVQSAWFEYGATGTPDLNVATDTTRFDNGIILSNGSAIGIQGNYYGDENYDNVPGAGITKAPEAPFPSSQSGFNPWNTPWGVPVSPGTVPPEVLAAVNLLPLPPGTLFYDPNVLQFQFTLPQGAWNISFDYAFASEEYIDFVGSPFNDAFGFYIDGANVAVLSDGTTPITVNSINPLDSFGVYNAATNPAGVYRNNVPGCTTSFQCGDPGTIVWPSENLDLEPDGLTRMLATQPVTLGPGTHSATMVIADVNDPELDSAVFVRGGSFLATPAVPEPGTLVLIGSGLLGLMFVRRRIR